MGRLDGTLTTFDMGADNIGRPVDFRFDSSHQNIARHAAIHGRLNRNAQPRASEVVNLPWAEAGGSARNRELDGERRSPGLERPEVGRRNRSLRRDTIVTHAHRTKSDGRIVGCDLRLGQVIADRAVRFVAIPIITGDDLGAPGNTGEIAKVGCLVTRNPVICTVLNAKNRVQARSGERHRGDNSGEEPSHDRTGWTISQGRDRIAGCRGNATYTTAIIPGSGRNVKGNAMAFRRCQAAVGAALGENDLAGSWCESLLL